MLRELVTVDDLADIFAVHRTTVWRWRAEHEGMREYEVTIPGRGQNMTRYRLKGLLRWAARTGISTPGLPAWRLAHATVPIDD
jgi:hypothetical protein